MEIFLELVKNYFLILTWRILKLFLQMIFWNAADDTKSTTYN